MNTPTPSSYDAQLDARIAAADQARTETIADIQTTLTKIRDLAGYLEVLIHGNSRGLGFLTPEHLEDRRRAWEAERAAMAQRLALGEPIGTGHTSAPGDLAAISASAELWATTRHHLRITIRRVPTTSAPQFAHLEPTTVDGTIRALSLALDHATPRQTDLDTMRRDLEHVHRTLDRVVNGHDRSRLNTPCPYCGRHTLVVDHRNGTVTCDRDPHTGHHHPCTCTDQLCPCHTTPITHRHTWHQDRGARHDGWWALSDLLNRNRKANPS